MTMMMMIVLLLLFWGAGSTFDSVLSHQSICFLKKRTVTELEIRVFLNP
jgi:hypothetical protein